MPLWYGFSVPNLGQRSDRNACPWSEALQLPKRERQHIEHAPLSDVYRMVACRVITRVLALRDCAAATLLIISSTLHDVSISILI